MKKKKSKKTGRKFLMLFKWNIFSVILQETSENILKYPWNDIFFKMHKLQIFSILSKIISWREIFLSFYKFEASRLTQCSESLTFIFLPRSWWIKSLTRWGTVTPPTQPDDFLVIVKTLGRLLSYIFPTSVFTIL